MKKILLETFFITFCLIFILSCGNENYSGQGKSGKSGEDNRSSSETPDNSSNFPGSDNSKSTELVDCVKYCSTNKVLKSVRQRSKGYGFLAFRNFSVRYKRKVGTVKIGQCRGHGIVNQRFTYLARFDHPNEKTPCDEGVETDACHEYLAPKILQVRNFAVVDFPGFKSLAEFSSHPNVMKLLRREIIKVPHKYSTLPEVIKNDGESRKERVFLEVLRRVKQFRYPYIAVEGTEVGKHGLVAYESRVINGFQAICFRDPNYIPKSFFEDCQNYAYFNQEGRLRYKRENKPESSLFRFELFRDEKMRTIRFIKSVRMSCIERSAAQNLCRSLRFEGPVDLDQFLQNEIAEDLDRE